MGKPNKIHELMVELTDPEVCDYAEFPDTTQVYVVRSESDPMGVHYVMRVILPNEDIAWICTCKGWRFTGACHHLETVKVATEPESVKLD